MFSVTTAAIKQLDAMLKSLSPGDIHCVRLEIVKRQAVFRLGSVRDGDRIFRHEDREVLVVDQDVMSASSGLVLDYDDRKKRFCVANPSESN